MKVWSNCFLSQKGGAETSLPDSHHHAGVFMTNEEPAKFHIHTIARTTPNVSDYRCALWESIRALRWKYIHGISLLSCKFLKRKKTRPTL